MADYSKRRFFAATFLLAAVICGGIWLWRPAEDVSDGGSRPTGPATGQGPESPPIPGIASSPFRNTSTKATYVGSSTCIECHDDAYQSYLNTMHSRAFGKVDPGKEPPDGRFFHAKSGREYRVYRRDGELRHREVIPGRKGKPDVVLADFPLAYTIGSGHHSRSYLIDVDGFLYESPVTWYASRHAWQMSPGYDRPRHFSFARPAPKGCVSCHSGRAQSIGGSLHRLRIHESRIGCESCHGPGSLHVELRLNPVEPLEGADRTIVNPRRLSRERNESLCAQCHLRGASVAFVRGRKPDDFRPGLPLRDFRIDYRLDSPGRSMKVTGHLEQMHLSRCFTESKTLTCTTCHDPHFKPDPSQRARYYRTRCLSCHETDGGCGLPEPERLAKNPQNDCVACHMPRAETDIPHFAFTHHRIGLRHSTKYEEPKTPRGRLVPIGDISHLPPLDRERCLGLANLEYSGQTLAGDDAWYQQRAFELLREVYRGGLRDAELLSALAWLYRRRNTDRAVALAEESLRFDAALPSSRSNALALLGEIQLKRENVGKARSAFERLVTYRRQPGDWKMLAICRARDGDLTGARAAAETAVAIRRDDPKLHMLLAEACQATGRTDEAKEHREIAQRLTELQQTRSPSVAPVRPHGGGKSP